MRARSLHVSVLPVPAGPAGAPPAEGSGNDREQEEGLGKQGWQQRSVKEASVAVVGAVTGRCRRAG